MTFMKCFVYGINAKFLDENIEYEIERTYPNSDGASIYDQQKKIPGYDLMNSYLISCGDISYDIDRVGWSQLPTGK